jgi:hypothetical protein
LKLFHVALVASLLIPSVTLAQTKPQTPAPSDEQTVGVTAFEQVQVNSTLIGLVSSVDTNVGYNLSEHLGGDVGIPVFYTRSPLSLVTNHDWQTTWLFGDPYIDLRYTTVRDSAKITSVLTATGGVSSIRIYSTGRPNLDLFNHIEAEKSFLGIIPFINFGVSNGTMNRYYMPRPYSIARPYETLGLLGDGELGATHEIRPGYKIGVSGYGLAPGGPQKIFSRLVTPGSSVVGVSTGDHDRYFFTSFETVGPSKIARDNGYSGWLDITKAKNIDLQVAYTRSTHYHWDALTVSLNFNWTDTIRALTGQSGQ